MRLAFALCFLGQVLWFGTGAGEHPTADRAGCLASGACYSLHHSTIKREAAEEACSLRGGALSTVQGGAELRTVLALLRAGPGPGGGSKDLVFWVALQRERSHCTMENEPLRGFSWMSPDASGAENDTLPWVEEPQSSCTARKCAGLQTTGGVEPAGWKEMRCSQRANGYLCKYQFEALCPAPRLGAASNLSYRAPFQMHSAALDFSPPGTKVSALCPGQLLVSATCLVDETGTHWDGLPLEAMLCPCPGPYLRAGKCMELSDCLDDSGGFACECAPGFHLGTDRLSCVTNGEVQTEHRGTNVSTRRPPRVPEPSGLATAIPGILQGEALSTMPTFQTSPQTKAGNTTTPAGSIVRIIPINSTSSSAIPTAWDSSTVVFILVSIAVVVLVILTMTVLGLFKLCFHKSPSSRPVKGPLSLQGVESSTEAHSPSSSAPCTDNGVKAGDSGLRDRAGGASLAESSLGPGSDI